MAAIEIIHGESPMRQILLIFLIIGALVLSFFFYYRAKAEKIYQQAMMPLPEQPNQSFQKILPLLSISNMLTLGRAGELRNQYRREISKITVESLQQDVPREDNFRRAANVVSAIGIFNNQNEAAEVKRQRIDIIKAARQTLPSILKQGTLSDWRNLLQFFNLLEREQPNLLNDAMTDYPDWHKEMISVDIQPLAEREAIYVVHGSFQSGLQIIGLKSDMINEWCRPIPQNLSSDQLIKAHNAFALGLEQINYYVEEVAHDDIPTTLAGVRLKLIHNILALQVAHLQDLGGAGRLLISDYIAREVIDTNTSVVPNSSAIYDAFLENTRNKLIKLQQKAIDSPNIAEPMHMRYSAIIDWSIALLPVSGPDGDNLLNQAKQQLIEANVDQGAAMEMILHQQRPLIILNADD